MGRIVANIAWDRVIALSRGVTHLEDHPFATGFEGKFANPHRIVRLRRARENIFASVAAAAVARLGNSAAHEMGNLKEMNRLGGICNCHFK